MMTCSKHAFVRHLAKLGPQVRDGGGARAVASGHLRIIHARGHDELGTALRAVLREEPGVQRGRVGPELSQGLSTSAGNRIPRASLNESPGLRTTSTSGPWPLAPLVAAGVPAAARKLSASTISLWRSSLCSSLPIMS